MKNHLAFFVFGCILLMLMQGLNAQIVNICIDTDSVTLTLDNYQYGNIQWQKSTDNRNWENIEGAIFRNYTCLPEKSTYYRAWISYQACPPDSSQVTFLQRKIQANAGLDKVLNNGFATELFANEYDGTQGQWIVLSGDSAYIENPNEANTLFYGTDSLYQLCWSLSSACGTTYDTITIEYVTNIYYDKIVIVDTTDIIVSDSAEMAEGIYRIVFNDPVPTISYSSILVGMSDGGFLRKVQSYIQIGDTCCMNTVPASPSELLVYGTIHINDFASMIHGRGNSIPNMVKLDHLPTRAEILSDPLFYSNKMVYYPIEEVSVSTYQQNANRSGWQISFPHPSNSIGISAGLEIADASFNCKPQIEFQITSKWNEPLSLSFGSNNGTLDAMMRLRVTAPSIDLPLFHKTIWKCSRYYLVFIGWLPVLYSMKFNLFVEGDASVSFSTPFGAELTHHADYDARLLVDDWVPSKSFSYDGETDGHFTETTTATSNYSVDIGVYLAGEIYLSIYESLSAYFSIGPRLDWSLCHNHEEGHIGSQQGISFGGLAKIGLRPGDLFENFPVDLGDLNFSFDFLKKDMRHPSRIEYVSGNHQIFAGNNVTLPQPVRIKSYTFFNNPSAGDIVYFEPIGGGYVNCPNNCKETGEDGSADVMWSPANRDSKLKISVFDCENNHIDGSPIYITTSNAECANSTLTARAYLDRYFVDLMVSGGVPPYQYSTDGMTYEDYFTMFVPENDETYVFYVKDSLNCVTTASHSSESNKNIITCLNTNVSYPISECFVLDADGIRNLIFNTPVGSIYFCFANRDSGNLGLGTYYGVPEEEFGESGTYFCISHSGLTAFNSMIPTAMTEGTIAYSQQQGLDIITINFADANGHMYNGTFVGTLEYRQQ